jgi:hypothetical protein
MKKTFHFVIFILLLAPLYGDEVVDGIYTGDLRIQADSGIEAGDLLVEGSVDVQGPAFSLGVAGTDPGLAVTYDDGSGSVGTIDFTGSRASTAWRWLENGASGTPKLQMKLDPSNILTLYNTSTGAVGLTLNPNTGDLTLQGGLVFADGGRMTNRSDVRAQALYDAAGNVIASLDGNGKLVLSPALKLSQGIEFSGGASLGQSNVSYLQQALINLGYRENPPVINDQVLSNQLNGTYNLLDVRYDSAGNLIVIGSFTNAANFGNNRLYAAGGTDIFVAKMTGGGSVLWAKAFGGAGSDGGRALSLDSSGNIYVTGNFTNTVTFGAGFSLTSAAGTSDIFLVKLDANGNTLWAKSFAGSEDDMPSSLAVDPTGNAFLAGVLLETITFGSTPLTSQGGTDVFLIKTDSNGNVAWAKKFGGTGADQYPCLTLDAGGNPMLAGSFSATATFGSVSLTSAGNTDTFLAKLNGNGDVIWAKKFGGIEADNPFALIKDAAGNVLFSGSFRGTATFDAITLTAGPSTSGDSFLAKVDGNGAVLWAKRFGGNNLFQAFALGLDAASNIYMSGNYSGTVTLGATTLVGVGSFSLFLAKMDSNGNVVSAVAGKMGPSIIGGTSAGNRLIFNGTSMTLAGYTGGNNWLGAQIIPAGSFLYTWTGEINSETPPNTASLVWGSGKSSAQGSVALGAHSSATASGATALGGSSASGIYSFSAGVGTRAQGWFSTALGRNTSATGTYALASGSNTIAAGNGSVAFGGGTMAAGNTATVFGNASTASGDYSTAFGLYTTAQSYASFALGQYNIPQGDPLAWQPTDDLFIIGNGSSPTLRSNAFVVKKNGDTTVNGKLTATSAQFDGPVRIAPQGDLSMGPFTAQP